jgi:hypothetical protein
MDQEKNRDMLKPRMQGLRKPSKGICHFLMPTKMMKEGRTILTKRCIAYIPGFEVKEDRLICELCLVPDMMVREDRCRHFVPLQVTLEEATSWKCAKTGKKWIEAAQCTCELCPDYECSAQGKWEIGRMSSGTPISSSDEGKADSGHGEFPRTCGPKDEGRKSRLIPKTYIGKKKTDKSEEE